MPLVALDTQLIDIFVEVPDIAPDAADTIEATAVPPPALRDVWRAACWIMTLAPVWTSTLFTFSDQLLAELTDMPPHKRAWAQRCLQFAFDARDGQPGEYCRPVQPVPVTAAHVGGWGVKPKDAVHVADAIGLGATHFLTRDGQLLKRSKDRASRYGLKVEGLCDFVRGAFLSGAPFPVDTTLDLL